MNCPQGLERVAKVVATDLTAATGIPPKAVWSRFSLLVGEIEEVVRTEEGDELKVIWYTPKRRATPRIYGKGGSSHTFNKKRYPRTRIRQG